MTEFLRNGGSVTLDAPFAARRINTFRQHGLMVEILGIYLTRARRMWRLTFQRVKLVPGNISG